MMTCICHYSIIQIHCSKFPLCSAYSPLLIPSQAPNLIFLAVSPEEKESWISALSSAITRAKNRVLDEVGGSLWEGVSGAGGWPSLENTVLLLPSKSLPPAPLSLLYNAWASPGLSGGGPALRGH